MIKPIIFGLVCFVVGLITGFSLVIDSIVLALACFAIGLVAGVSLTFTLLMKGMKLVEKSIIGKH